MHITREQVENTIVNNLRTKAGAFLVFSGTLILVDLYSLRTGWLCLTLLPLLGALMLAGSLVSRRYGWLIAASLVSGVGWGSFLALSSIWKFSVFARVGIFCLFFGLSWYLITLLTGIPFRHPAWWALIPGGVIGGVGTAFLYSRLSVFDFIFHISVGLGLGFLVWGLVTGLLGLIIPGALIISMGPGTAAAWTRPELHNALARTGAMLVCYALGWILITLLSRRVTHRFIWWPLIPGGVMAMVGWGLYIAGNPGNAVAFIGNTGSIGLILFGVYLLLLRKGIQQ
jgi:hypothetical protein